MIHHLLVNNNAVTGKLQVSAYPRIMAVKPRTYENLTDASRRRLEKEIKKLTIRPVFVNEQIVLGVFRDD